MMLTEMHVFLYFQNLFNVFLLHVTTYDHHAILIPPVQK